MLTKYTSYSTILIAIALSSSSTSVFTTLPIIELAVITKKNLEWKEVFFDDNDERLFPHDED